VHKDRTCRKSRDGLLWLPQEWDEMIDELMMFGSFRNFKIKNQKPEHDFKNMLRTKLGLSTVKVQDFMTCHSPSGHENHVAQRAQRPSGSEDGHEAKVQA